jgi:hypothetical protein
MTNQNILKDKNKHNITKTTFEEDTFTKTMKSAVKSEKESPVNSIKDMLSSYTFSIGELVDIFDFLAQKIAQKLFENKKINASLEDNSLTKLKDLVSENFYMIYFIKILSLILLFLLMQKIKLASKKLIKKEILFIGI